MGAQMVKEVASKSSDAAGDGTTTATVLAQAIVKQGAKSVAAGMNPMDLKRGIDLALDKVLNDLKSRAKKLGSSEKLLKLELFLLMVKRDRKKDCRSDGQSGKRRRNNR